MDPSNSSHCLTYVNPCDVANCTQECKVTANGTSQCYCFPGYIVIPPRPTECAVADVCALLSGGGCDQQCINLPPGDGYRCECPLAGFRLSDDQKTCEQCPDGRYGTDCQFTCNCDFGTCDSASGFCDCAVGYEGQACNESKSTEI